MLGRGSTIDFLAFSVSKNNDAQKYVQEWRFI